MVGERRSNQILRDLGENRRRRDRRLERHRPRDRVHVGEANAHGDGPAGERLRAEPRGDLIGEVTQGGSENPLDRGLPSERGLRAGGSRRGCVRICADRGSRRAAELLAGGVAEQPFERAARVFASCPMVTIPWSASLLG